MFTRPASARFVRFGIFEADLQERELRRKGLKVRLQRQPFEVLAALLERPGETVTGEELSRRIWPEGTFVEFDHSLSTAILKIRRVLEDAAENPRFIETVPRHGYRFIAPIQIVAESQFGPRRTSALTQRLRWFVPLVAVTALAISTVSDFLPEERVPGNLLSPRPLTAAPGSELNPSFSPDGNQVAYAWCEEGSWVLRGNCDVFVKLIGTESSLLLTRYPWVDVWPAWSPDGRFIAFLRHPPEGMASYCLIPAIGGQERLLARTFPPMPPLLLGTGISWFPDGRHIAVIVRDSWAAPRCVALLSVETGEQRALTNPPSESVGDTALAVSPDGARIAFARIGTSRSTVSEIFLLELSDDLTAKGRPKRLASQLIPPVALAWMADGNTLVFSSDGRLWRIAASVDRAERPELLTFAGEGASDPALSRDGLRLAYSLGRARQDIWHLELTGSGQAGGSTRELISSTRVDGWPQYSTDGRRIAFLSDRSGIRQLYLCDADGSNLLQLTSFETGVEAPYPGWSPDGEGLLFTVVNGEGNSDVFEIDVQSGETRRLTTGAAADFHPRWSQDGKTIYFASNRSGETQIWRMPALGGEMVKVTENGGEGPFESPDGKFLYYFKPGSGGTEQVWRLPLSGGREELVLGDVFRGNFSMSGEDAYFIPQMDVDCECYHLQRLNLATGKREPVIDVKNIGGGLSVSADGRYLLYATVVHTSRDLMLVEDFH